MKSRCRRHRPAWDNPSLSHRLKMANLAMILNLDFHCCLDCRAIGALNKHWRCPCCGSDAVVRDKSVHTMNTSTTDNVAPPQHDGCNTKDKDEAPVNKREKP